MLNLEPFFHAKIQTSNKLCVIYRRAQQMLGFTGKGVEEHKLLGEVFLTTVLSSGKEKLKKINFKTSPQLASTDPPSFSDPHFMKGKSS